MFVGISGVGKTTFLGALRSSLSFQHLTAGTLIAAGAETNLSDRDELRLANISNNQRLLINGFNLKRDQQVEMVVLDGHAIIDTGNGLEEISVGVFAELKITAMVHLTATPERIFANRSNDMTRVRPLLSVDELRKHQDQSVAYSQVVASLLSIPFVEVTERDQEKMLELVAAVRGEL